MADTIIGGEFRILRPLRSGGMGSVYVAMQQSTGKARAVKLLAPSLAQHPDARERFVREAHAAGAIESEHVVEIVSAGIDMDTDTPYIAMELLQGEDLGDRVARLGRLPFEEVVEILSQVGHALELAHAQQIIHRDLKPENIFIAKPRRLGTDPFCAKLLDFGVAKFLLDASPDAGTQPVGSPAYMAPEQTDAFGNLSPCADVWSIGLVAFFALTGESYWMSGFDASVPAILREVCFEPLDAASTRIERLGLNVKLPAGFDDWFSKCVERDPAMRYPEAGEAIRALRALLEEDRAGAYPLFDDVADEHIDVIVSMPPEAKPPSVHPEAGVTMPPRASSPALTLEAGRLPKTWIGVSIGAGLVAAAASSMLVEAVIMRGHSEKNALRHDEDTAAAASTEASAPAPEPEDEEEADAKEQRPRVEAKVAPTSAPTIAPAEPTQEPSVRAAAPPMRSSSGGRCPVHMVLHASSSGQSAFCVDETEVTVASYVDCVSRGRCAPLTGIVDYPGLRADVAPDYRLLCNMDGTLRGRHPVNCVSWDQANRYCASAGAKLPTLRQFRSSIGIDDGPRARPEKKGKVVNLTMNVCDRDCQSWGYEHGLFFSTFADVSDGFAATAPVGSYPASAARSGELDLYGNVAEWTSDARGDARLIVGGSFLTGKAEDLTDPVAYPPTSTVHTVGFRCAIDLDDPRSR